MGMFSLTMQDMQEYGFSLTRIFPYKDRIIDSILIRENAVRQKTRFLAYFAQYFHKNALKYNTSRQQNIIYIGKND